MRSWCSYLINNWGIISPVSSLCYEGYSKKISVSCVWQALKTWEKADVCGVWLRSRWKNSDFRTLMHNRKKHLNKYPFPPWILHSHMLVWLYKLVCVELIRRMLEGSCWLWQFLGRCREYLASVPPWEQWHAVQFPTSLHAGVCCQQPTYFCSFLTGLIYS